MGIGGKPVTPPRNRVILTVIYYFLFIVARFLPFID